MFITYYDATVEIFKNLVIEGCFQLASLENKLKMRPSLFLVPYYPDLPSLFIHSYSQSPVICLVILLGFKSDGLNPEHSGSEISAKV
jgi:hypothetical protein